MKKILIADDDNLLLETLIDYLNEQGFVVHGCANHVEFAQALVSNQFDVILCDFKLPKFSFAREFSKLLALTQIPILILTTANQDLIDYFPREHKLLPKPFNMAALTSLLN